MFTFFRRTKPARKRIHQRPAPWKPRLEVLEDRSLPSVFFTDFNSGAPAEFSGVTGTGSVQGYAGIGTDSNVFSGLFLRNASPGNPASATTLSMSNLPAHTSIDLNFLLGVIDSWDGNGIGDGNTSSSPDFFNVRVDGVTIFSTKLSNQSRVQQDYVPPPGVELAFRQDLGFSTGMFYFDSAYNMGLDPIFDNIPHTSSTLTIQWFASGAGWSGGTDESWAIDNVEVILNPASDIIAASLSWTSAQGPVDFSYQITGTSLPQNTTVDLYWAKGDATADILKRAFSVPGGRAVGTYVEHVQVSALETPPSGATRLLLVVDPPTPGNPNGTITEAREDNNTRSVMVRPIAWGQRVSTDFISRVVAISDNLGTNPNHLMAAMAFETGETFSPSIRNSQSGAVGLIQFLPQTAKDLGTTVGELAAMTAVRQLDFVEKYLAPYAGRLNRLQDVYMAILYPSAIGKPSDFVVFDSNSSDPKLRKAYRQNRGLDINDDGVITVEEATELVRRKLEKGFRTNFVSYYFAP